MRRNTFHTDSHRLRRNFGSFCKKAWSQHWFSGINIKLFYEKLFISLIFTKKTNFANCFHVEPQFDPTFRSWEAINSSPCARYGTIV